MHVEIKKQTVVDNVPSSAPLNSVLARTAPAARHGVVTSSSATVGVVYLCFISVCGR